MDGDHVYADLFVKFLGVYGFVSFYFVYVYIFIVFVQILVLLDLLVCTHVLLLYEVVDLDLVAEDFRKNRDVLVLLEVETDTVELVRDLKGVLQLVLLQVLQPDVAHHPVDGALVEHYCQDDDAVRVEDDQLFLCTRESARY